MGDYIFEYEPDKKFLLLVDLSGAKSGELMKNLNYVAPRDIEKFQMLIKNGSYKVGDYIEFGNRVFFFVRKHYMSKFNLEEFRKIAGNLPYEYTYKTTNENEKLEPYLDVLVQIYDRIEIYRTSKKVW